MFNKSLKLSKSCFFCEIKIRIDSATSAGNIIYKTKSNEAVVKLQLRPDGGYSYTHDICEKFSPSKEKVISSFGAYNGIICVSTATIPYKKGEYCILICVNENRSFFSAYVYQDGLEYPLPLAIDFMLSASIEDGITEVCFEGNGAEIIDFTNAAPLQPRTHREPCIINVGKHQKYECLQKAAFNARPGDIVLVDINYKHKGSLLIPYSGEKDNPIIFMGVTKGAKRPLIDGDFSLFSVEICGNNVIFNGFEIINGAKAGINHHADNVVIENCIIHNCLMGILSDQDINMGDLEVANCEIYGCGYRAHSHQIYTANDVLRFPNAIVKIHDCYIHNAYGGNNIKSRAHRNEIYNNRIIDAFYHNLELIGPDMEFNPCKIQPLPCNSYIWNNKFENSKWYQFRFGGDGTGDSNGCFYFFENTVYSDFIHNEDEELRVFRIMFGINLIDETQNEFIYAEKEPSSLYRVVMPRWVDTYEKGTLFKHKN